MAFTTSIAVSRVGRFTRQTSTCTRRTYVRSNRRRLAYRASAATPADVTAAAEESDAAQVEHSFERLKHPNPMQRKMASSYLGSVATPEVISRLVALMPEQDTNYRRSAVQALGMCGEAAISAVVSELRATEDATARASCAKALAATALFHPEMRATFPKDALDALGEAVQGADPVTKIAAVGCLGTLGCDARGRDGTDAGSEEAYNILAGMVSEGVDAATGAVAVGALAQIGQNGDAERKASVVGKLKSICGDNTTNAVDDDSGLGYVREMARAHIEQLEGGLKSAGSR